jgi:cytochrome b
MKRDLPNDVRQAATVSVWDPLVRVFHWGLATSFLIAYAIGEHGGAVHLALGYAALGFVLVRVTWGFVGTRHARFADFVPGLSKLIGYLRDILARRESRYLGHNPAGAVMILLLLIGVIGTGVTGWMMTLDQFGESLEDVHEVLAGTTLTLVAIHVLGVIYESIRQRENLVAAMLTGRKRR